MLICGVLLFNFVSVAVYRAHFKINYYHVHSIKANLF